MTPFTFEAIADEYWLRRWQAMNLGGRIEHLVREQMQEWLRGGPRKFDPAIR